MIEITEISTYGGIKLGPDWLFHIEEWKHPWHKSAEVKVYQIFNDSDGEFVGSFAYVPDRDKYLNFHTEYLDKHIDELWTTLQLGLAWILRERRLEEIEAVK